MSDRSFEYVEPRRVFWLRGLLQHLAASMGKHKENNPGYRICAFPNDLIGREIAVSGTYEAAGISAVNWLCENGVIKAPGAAFLDIGANVGVYTVGLASQFSSVLAFEPHPVVHRILDLNLAANDLHDVRTFNFGLSDHDGLSQLWEGTADNVGAASLERGVGTGRCYSVTLRHAATAVREATTLPIAFIKMDVEGHEPKLIHGLESVILEQLPVIAFEANDPSHNQAMLLQLRSLGYTTFLALVTGSALPFLWLRVSVLTLTGVRSRLKLVSDLDGKRYSLVFALSPRDAARWRNVIAMSDR